MRHALSREQARAYVLAYHFLDAPRELEGTDGVLKVAERLRCLQVDPLNVVGRNVHLVMQSRVGRFRTDQLDRLIYEDHELVEAWDKVRSVVPSADWPGLEPFRRRMRERHERTGNPPADVIDYVRSQIASRGAVDSLDLGDRGRADWRWAPARAVRAALEIMFDWGELGIAGRNGGRKVYAPMGTLLGKAASRATKVDEPMDAYHRRHVRRRVAAVGLIADRSGDVWQGIVDAKAPERRRAIDALVDAGTVASVEVEGVRARCLAPAGACARLLSVGSDSNGAPGGRRQPEAAFIAPLDNLIWDRRLVSELFGFSYTWEVYKPASRRQYGYYVLPVLLGDRFVARWEPRRLHGTLAVRGWWWERGNASLRDDPVTREAVGRALVEFLGFLGVSGLVFEDGVREADRRFLRKALG
ncbi:MAG: DNA glycosylase AlkZ-like family protein [Spirochaetota bacterium]